MSSMQEKKIVVPDGMLKAAIECRNLEGIHKRTFEAILEAALRWLSDNPIKPTRHQVTELMVIPFMFEEWQRRMFLAPEPEIPEELRDMVCVCSQRRHHSCPYRLQY